MLFVVQKSFQALYKYERLDFSIKNLFIKILGQILSLINEVDLKNIDFLCSNFYSIEDCIFCLKHINSIAIKMNTENKIFNLVYKNIAHFNQASYSPLVETQLIRCF